MQAVAPPCPDHSTSLGAPTRVIPAFDAGDDQTVWLCAPRGLYQYASRTRHRCYTTSAQRAVCGVAEDPSPPRSCPCTRHALPVYPRPRRDHLVRFVLGVCPSAPAPLSRRLSAAMELAPLGQSRIIGAGQSADRSRHARLPSRPQPHAGPPRPDPETRPAQSWARRT
ncbi:hypothetical protein B0H10DRAFT_657169 [Mycena sp. CBHHK59/15]|nr:hypothetical protein B0H10DRAFT_657169 [Mycena sp. CBHHK59/15]